MPVTISATNAAGTGTQTLILTVLRRTTVVAAISATNAAGTGTANLIVTIAR